MLCQHCGLGNVLVPPGSKPLPEPLLTQIYVTISHHLATCDVEMAFMEVHIMFQHEPTTLITQECPMSNIFIGNKNENLKSMEDFPPTLNSTQPMLANHMQEMEYNIQARWYQGYLVPISL